MQLLPLVGLGLSLAVLAGVAEDPTPTEAVQFETHVRPILVARCEECHADTADGGLRVDSREALLKGGDSGPAIVVGDPEASLLIQAIRHTKPGLHMPKRRAQLPADEIDTLVKWVTDGAYWPASKALPPGATRPKVDVQSQLGFWSLQPLRKPDVPSVADAAWAKNDIDRFVLAKLERAGLAPNDAADKATLIRRATFDLTGLPPTSEETAAFVADKSSEAFERVVDRLLASPHYGEAWGRWWLDVARYGEDDCRSLDPMGRGFNPYPYAYLYRDWVVQAQNDDMPYDGFVVAQLAADKLDEPRRTALLPALGFLGLGPWLYDNGSVEVTRADERHDRVDAVSRGLLGMTVACARCHDHKYDAIATEDYYAMASVFKNTMYREYPQVPQSVVDEFKKAEKRLEDREKLLREFQRTEGRQLSQAFALETSRYMIAAWSVLGDAKRDKGNVAAEEKLDYEMFDRWLAFLVKPQKHYKYLEKWQALIAARGKKDEAEKLAKAFQEVVLDVMFEHVDLEAENDIIRAKAQPGTKPKKRANLPDEFLTNDDFCPGCGLELKTLKDERNSLYIDLFERDLDQEMDLTAGGPGDSKPGLFAFDGFGLERQLGPERRRQIADLRAEVKKLRKELQPKYPYVHGVADVEPPSPIRVHVRGSPFRLGDEVAPRLPALLCAGTPVSFTQGSGRLELARAIVAHPITARVIVNRVWKWHFGTGIVDTASNFGQNGERPTNPELLEHLAWSFVDGGMSLKRLHRAILLSATYQLSSATNERNAAADEGNRLHWRANAHRLTAEQFHDAALTAAGTLDLEVGGPPVKLTPFGTRRTIYSNVSRYKLDEYLALFDFPSPNATAEGRFTTQVPLQRLFLMNSDFMQQQAESLARRVEPEPDDAARIQKMYGLLFARAATDAEVAAGKTFLATEPMKTFEGRKADQAKAEAEAKDKPASEKAFSGAANEKKPNDSEDEEGETPSPGMMAGVTEPSSHGRLAAKALPVTILGRYAKVLMSSHEFLFVR